MAFDFTYLKIILKALAVLHGSKLAFTIGLLCETPEQKAAYIGILLGVILACISHIIRMERTRK